MRKFLHVTGLILGLFAFTAKGAEELDTELSSIREELTESKQELQRLLQEIVERKRKGLLLMELSEKRCLTLKELARVTYEKIECDEKLDEYRTPQSREGRTNQVLDNQESLARLSAEIDRLENDTTHIDTLAKIEEEELWIHRNLDKIRSLAERVREAEAKLKLSSSKP